MNDDDDDDDDENANKAICNGGNGSKLAAGGSVVGRARRQPWQAFIYYNPASTGQDRTLTNVVTDTAGTPPPCHWVGAGYGYTVAVISGSTFVYHGTPENSWKLPKPGHRGKPARPATSSQPTARAHTSCCMHQRN